MRDEAEDGRRGDERRGDATVDCPYILILTEHGNGIPNPVCCLCGLTGNGSGHYVHWRSTTHACKGHFTGNYNDREWILEADSDQHGSFMMLLFQARQVERARSAYGVAQTEGRWIATIKQIMEAWWATVSAQKQPNHMMVRLKHYCGAARHKGS